MNERTDTSVLKAIGEIDQQLAAMGQMATVLYGYFNALVAQGFKPAQALELTCRWQDAIMSQFKSGDGK